MSAPQFPFQAQLTILDLPAGATPSGTEAIEAVQAGASVQLSLAQIIAALFVAPTIRLPAFGASISILTSDIEVGINTGTGAVNVNLPSALAWSRVFPGGSTGLDLVIVDVTGNAPTHNITPVLNGADTFLEGVTPVITTAFGSMRLRPKGNPVNGWYIRGLG